MKLATERLLIRNWTDLDREPLHAICSDTAVMQFVGDGSVWSRDRVEVFIDQNRRFLNASGYCQWAVELRDTRQLAGFCGFVPRSTGAEMGWRLAAEFHGRGLGTEMARAVLDYGVRRLQLTDFYLIVQAANRASFRLAEKIGCTMGPAFLRNGRAVIRFDWLASSLSND